MTIKLSLKLKISTRAVTLFWDPVDDRSKMLTYHQISLKLFFAYKLSYKKSKSVKQRVIGSILGGINLQKTRARRSAHPRYE